ncbi:hypothetical protein [Candidatus Finniella inopinata]|uniref:Uncharacterized protein n=1 Tax=Candidatus Finniella inopinata TaxID=1696036 RepID=A0A4Q7DH58_9PROT|nr:hypothetical protein [Candidatus Finniella inopinata]RZI45588.1 hypothetical protein EQU50_06595 [Candidatus Finniella inopinata]
MNKHLFWLIFFLGIKAQAHTFMPIDDFINGYEAYAKEKELSIRLSKIQTDHHDRHDLEIIDYTDSQDPVLLELRKNSLSKKTAPLIVSRSFKFDIVTKDTTGDTNIGRFILHEGVEPVHGSFFSISHIRIARKYADKETEAETKALQDAVKLFEAINPYCDGFSFYILSDNHKAALSCARAGFWLSDERTGEKIDNLELFADFILDHTRLDRSKAMIRERNDPFIPLPIDLKDDKHAVIKILTETQSRAISVQPDDLSSASSGGSRRSIMNARVSSRKLVRMSDEDLWAIAREHSLKDLYKRGNVPYISPIKQVDSRKPTSTESEVVPSAVTTAVSSAAASVSSSSSTATTIPRPRSISSFLWKLFSTLTLSPFSQTRTTEPVILMGQ